MDDSIESLSKRRCVTLDVETSISRLVEIVEPPVNVPRYATYHTSFVATGKIGQAPGEFLLPYGVAIDEETHQIFVANNGNNRVDIFSETGEFISQLGDGQLPRPYGITIHGYSVYVSCEDHTVSKFSLSEMCRIRRIGGKGSNNGQFDFPQQLTTDLIGRVFIADSGNHRICIHDPDLNNICNFILPFISRPSDVKVSRDRLYVLCPGDNPCMHVLTLQGYKLHSFITCGEEMDVLLPNFFCLDPLNNLILSDPNSHSIRVFSPEGNLIHTIVREGPQQGMLALPYGVAIAPNGRLVCVSWMDYCLQISY